MEEAPIYQTRVEWIEPEDFYQRFLRVPSSKSLILDIRTEEHTTLRPYIQLSDQGPHLARIPNHIMQDALGHIMRQEGEEEDESSVEIFGDQGVSLQALLERRGIDLLQYEDVVFVCGSQPLQVHLAVENALSDNTDENMPVIHFLREGIDGQIEGIEKELRPESAVPDSLLEVDEAVVQAGCGNPVLKLGEVLNHETLHYPVLRAAFPVQHCTTQIQQGCEAVCASFQCHPGYVPRVVPEDVEAGLKKYKVTEEGFLENLEDWTEEFAVLMAKRYHDWNLSDSTPENHARWRIIRGYREYGVEGFGSSPYRSSRRKMMERLFPDEERAEFLIFKYFDKTAEISRLAGLRDPRC